MLRQILKNTVRYRCVPLISHRQCKSLENNLKEENTSSTTNSNKGDVQLVKETFSHQTFSNYKPVTSMPFAELNNLSKDTNVTSDIAEFIDELASPLPVAFNLAAYVNQSESLQKLVQLGVDLSYIEKKPEKAKYILKLDFEKDMKSHIQFLHDCGVSADLLGRFITKNPLIFKVSIENLKIRINYMKSKKFSDEAISRIISCNPYFLGHDTKIVDSRLGFLQKQFSLTGNEVRALITKSPNLVTYDFQEFREKLFAMKEELGFDSKEMKIILLKKPKVWLIGRGQLKKRFQVLHNIMGLSHEQILTFPDILLLRSFIMKQRHQYLVQLNRAQYDPQKPMYISLKDFVQVDSTFCEKCAKTSVEEYNKFLRTL